MTSLFDEFCQQGNKSRTIRALGWQVAFREPGLLRRLHSESVVGAGWRSETELPEECMQLAARNYYDLARFLLRTAVSLPLIIL